MLDNFRKVYDILKEKSEFVNFTMVEEPVTIEIVKGEIEALNNIKITKDSDDSIVLLTRSLLCNIRQYEDFIIVTTGNLENYIFTDYKNK